MTAGKRSASGRAAEIERVVADMQGVTAMPRSNGELVFEEPWESRAFGAAVALAEAGAFEWESFRQSLIADIGAWEAEHDDADADPAEWSYYERWLAALEALLADRGIVSAAEIEARAAEVAEAAEHEHDHDHGAEQ